MGIYKEVDNASLEELKMLWNSPTPDWADSRDSLLEEVSYVLSKIKPEGVNFLKSFSYSKDKERRGWAVYFLADKEIIDSDIIKYLVDMFNVNDKILKTLALWGFINVDHFPIQRSVIESLMNGKDERLAALAMVYLSYAYSEESIELLQEGLLSSNPRKREYACDEVGDRAIHQLKEYLVNLLTDPDDYVRQAATSNLELFK